MYIFNLNILKMKNLYFNIYIFSIKNIYYKYRNEIFVIYRNFIVYFIIFTIIIIKRSINN